MLGRGAKERKTPKEKGDVRRDKRVYVEHTLQAGKKWLAEDHKQYERFKRTLEKEFDEERAEKSVRSTNK